MIILQSFAYSFQPLSQRFSQQRLYSSSNLNATDKASLLTEQEKKNYQRDGFILKKNLITGDQLADLIKAGESLYEKKHEGDKMFAKFFAKLRMNVWQQDELFKNLAFSSSFPDISAELMGMKPHHNMDDNKKEKDESSSRDNTVRILKDGFFGFKGVNNTGCGFHVDDKSFWPATDESTGVNFWLALSPMRVKEGGGIRVVSQDKVSNKLKERCLSHIRSEGAFTTCALAQLSPEDSQQLLERSTVFDMEPGDALIWDRWTFHRSEPFVVETEDHKLRYTIRYVPGSAKAEGFGLHESQKEGEYFNSAYYPQVWPETLPSEQLEQK